MASFAREAGVEGHTELDQVADPRRSLLRQHSHGAFLAQFAAGGERVGGVQLGVSSAPSAAATPPCAK